MCFSPQVDVIAGIAIAAVAVDAVRHCHSARTAPLAALPAIFAVHTVISAAVWWGLWGDIPASLGQAALNAYLGIAFVLLPIYVPLAVLAIERPGWRRTALVALAVCGAYAGFAFLLGLTAGRGAATACPAYIDFTIDGTPSSAGILYVIATCGALLLSSDRLIAWWGVLNVAAVAVLLVLANSGLPSLWCFWAACTSVFIAWFLRRQEPSTAPAGGDAAQPQGAARRDAATHDVPR
jgi:hypothetical protein